VNTEERVGKVGEKNCRKVDEVSYRYRHFQVKYRAFGSIRCRPIYLLLKIRESWKYYPLLNVGYTRKLSDRKEGKTKEWVRQLTNSKRQEQNPRRSPVATYGSRQLTRWS